MELSRSCPVTEQSSHVTSPLHYYSKHYNQRALFYRLWKISEAVILKECVKIQFKMTITQMFRYISNVWYVFHRGLSNTNYSCSKHVLENTYTRDHGTRTCQDGTNFFKINLKNIWEWSEGTKDTAVWARI